MSPAQTSVLRVPPQVNLAPFLYALLALACCFAVLPFQYFIGNDGVYYARMAQNIWAGHGIVANVGQPYTTHPPFYPFVIGLVNLVLKNLELSAHLVSILAFALAAIPLFAVSRRIHSNEAAHFATFLYATHGFLILHAVAVLADSLFTLELLLCFWLTLKRIEGEGPTRLHSVLIGLLSGIAFLTRSESFIIYAAICFSLVLFAKKGFRSVLVSLPFFFACLVPYLLFVRASTGRWDLSTGIPKIFLEREYSLHPEGYFEGKKIYDGLTDDHTHLKRKELMEEFDTLDYFGKDRFKMIRVAFPSLFWRSQELNKYLYLGLGSLLIGASLFGRAWNTRRRAAEAVMILLLLTFLPKVLAAFHPRYFFHYIPLFLIWIGDGIELFRQWVRGTFHPRTLTLRFLTGAIGAGFLLFSTLYVARVIRNTPLPYEYREIGIWMRENLPGVERHGVAAHAAVAYYSGARILFLPYVEKIEDLLVYLRHQGGRYFVVSDDLHPLYLETYGPLLDESKPAPPGTQRLYRVEGGKRVILYALSPQNGGAFPHDAVSSASGGQPDPYFVS